MAISGSNDISLLQMGIGLLPVGISLFLSWKYKLGLSNPNSQNIAPGFFHFEKNLS